MTPAAKAAEIVSSWTSDNYMHPSARPAIQKQIEEAITEMMLLENRECAKAIDNKDGFGPESRKIAIEIIRSRYDTAWEV